MGEIKKLFKGFSKLSKQERFDCLSRAGLLDLKSIKTLKASDIFEVDLAEKFIENALGYFALPLGVATNFVIDGRELFIPMAVEETSIIAAASKTARWVNENGSLTTSMKGQESIGQIQISKLKSETDFKIWLDEHKESLIEQANKEVASGLVARGGGVSKIYLRTLKRPDGETMGVLHLHVNCCDAMGANIINQICEFLKTKIEASSSESVTMCILSNLTDTRLACAKVVLKNQDPVLCRKISEASLFAQLDPYRAATNNKGVLNGIDPIVIATGNDWRAVEAGMHAFAAAGEHYRSLSTWSFDEAAQELIGELVAPISVGIVGGVTKLHPMAQMGLQILGVNSADELSRICAAVGLVQNLGALKALSTVGIIEGHMKLHIKNLALSAGAKEQEVSEVEAKLKSVLQLQKRISMSHAVTAVQEVRTQRQSELVKSGA